MKPVKHLLSSSNKLASVPELSHKKGLLNSPLSPKLKEKQSSKSVCDKLEMVLRSPPTGESVVRYALPIPSSKTKELIAEDELLRKTTEHLKTIVSSLEETYGICNENVEKPVVKSEHEELSLSVGDDLNLFLECCSQFAAQLEGTVKEESHILESLFKWFQRQVNQMEEISKDQSFSEAEFPEPDRKVILNIAQVGKQIQKLEELKNRLKEGSKKSLKAMMSKIKNSEYSSEAVQSYENVQQKIEEFIRTHSAEELIDVSAIESQTTYSIPDRLNAMMKIFEKQSNTLERTKNDKILLETKYKQIQNDFQLLLEEKSVLENELQKLRNTETTKSTYDRTKKTMKMEKKKAKEKSEDSEAKQLKMEEFLKAKKTIYALETENKILQEQLKQALQVSIVHDGSTIENRSKKKRASTAISDISQILKSQDGSAFLKSSNEVSADEDLSPLSPSKPHDKSFTRELLSKDIKGLLSVGTLLPGNETVTTSFISPPVVTERKPVGSAISKAYILEEKLQSKTETQTYQEERKFQDHGQVPDENPVLEHQGSMSNTQLQVKKHRLSKGGRLNTYATLPDENRILENEESMTKPQMQEKKQRTSTEKTLTATQDKVPDKNRMLEHQDTVSKSEIHMKNQRTHKKKGLTTYATLPDENRILENEESMTKPQMQEKKQRTSTEKTLTATQDKVPDENRMLEHQDTVSKSEIHMKNQRTHKKKGLTTYATLPDENRILENEESMTKPQMQEKKQRTSTEKTLTATQDKVPDKNRMLEHQDTVSKSEIHMKNQRTHKKKGLTTYATLPDENRILENEESMTKPQMQEKKQRTSTEKTLTATQDKVPDENRMLEHQDTVSKSEIHMKNQRTHKKKGLTNEDSNELSNGNFTVEDLELATQRLSVNNEGASELSDTAENLLTTNPSISDLIFQLDLNKVTETDIEQLKDSIERRMLMGEMKILSKSLLEANIEHLPAAFGQELIKTQSKRHSGTNVELSTDAIARGLINEQLKTQSVNLPGTNVERSTEAITHDIIRGQLKTQSMDIPGTNVERSTDAITPGIIKGQLKTQSVDFPGTDAEHLPGTLRRGIIKGEVKTQSKSHSGTNVESSTDTITRGIIKGLLQNQSMDFPDTDTEYLPTAFGRGIIKEEVKTKSKSHSGTNVDGSTEAITRGIIKRQLKTQSMDFPDTDTEYLPGMLGRNIIKGEVKTQSKSHSGISIERSKIAVSGGITKGQLKTQSMDLPDTDIEHLLGPFGRGLVKGEVKIQSKTHAGSNTKHSTDAVAHGIIKGQIKTQSKDFPEVDTEQILDAIGRTIIKGKVKTQSKSHAETYLEHLTDTIGREKIISEIKEQLRSYADVNLFKNRDMAKQHQDNFFTIIPSKLSTNIMNFSPFRNQGMDLFKNKNMLSYHQDISTRRITPSKFPTKVINLSPFDSQGRTSEGFPSHVTEPSKALQRRSRAQSSIYKTINFPSLYRKSSGYPKNSVLNKKQVEMTNTLPAVNSKARKFIYKVPHMTAGKPSTYPYSSELKPFWAS